MSQQNQNPETVLSKISPRIKGAAYNIARRYDRLDQVDDVEQEITLAILEHYIEDPGFLSQSDSWIVNWGATAARWQILNAMGREKWESQDEGADDENGDGLLERVPAEDAYESATLALAVEQALAGLDAQDQQIVHLLAAGKTPREIGPAVGLHWKTIYNRMNGQIAQALQGCA